MVQIEKRMLINSDKPQIAQRFHGFMANLRYASKHILGWSTDENRKDAMIEKCDILWMEEILHQLVTIGNYKTL